MKITEIITATLTESQRHTLSALMDDHERGQWSEPLSAEQMIQQNLQLLTDLGLTNTPDRHD